MPEGPECRKIGQELAHLISSKVIVEINIISGRYARNPPTGLDAVRGILPIEVVGVGAHGKFLFWILKEEYSIWNTLGMTGNWSQVLTSHSRIHFKFAGGLELFFNDQRNFGTLKFVRGKFQLLEKLKSLGPDMLAEDIADEVFIRQLRQKSTWTLAKVLMDQSVVAGIGNYIKADSLWLARLSPHRKICDTLDEELSILNACIKRVMRESFQNGGATIQSYKDVNGDTGNYGNKFLVYNRQQDPDGNEIIRETTEDKRTTHWVPKVQL